MDAAKLTTKSQEALSEAVRRAAGSGHPAVEPVHLLLSLLGQPDGTAGHLLDAAGVDRAAVRARAEEALRRLPSASGSTVASPRSSPSYSVLQTRASGAANSATTTCIPENLWSAWPRMRRCRKPVCVSRRHTGCAARRVRV